MLLWDAREWATGFVISRRYRLVATAAHVADDAFRDGPPMQAIVDGTVTAYPVVRRWYHPRLSRKLDDGLYARSDDPKDGDVEYPTCDLAVLQLSDLGPELPAELHLAEDEDLRHLEGQPVGLLSYSGDDPSNWPIVGRPLAARLTTSLLRPAVTETERTNSRYKQFVYLDHNESDGASGCPIFLANGHVAAIECSSRSLSEEVEQIAGVRIDCLRELLTYHNLNGLMPTRDGQSPRHPTGDRILGSTNFERPCTGARSGSTTACREKPSGD